VDTSHQLTPETGRMLRAARLRAGLSLRAAARVVPANHPYLSALEAGRKAPSVAFAEALVAAYRMTGAEAEALLAEAVPGVGRDRRAGGNTMN